MKTAILCSVLILVISAAALGQSSGEIGPYEYDLIQSIHLSRDQTFQIEAAKSHQFELLSRHPLRGTTGVSTATTYVPARSLSRLTTGTTSRAISISTAVFESRKMF